MRLIYLTYQNSALQRALNKYRHSFFIPNWAKDKIELCIAKMQERITLFGIDKQCLFK